MFKTPLLCLTLRAALEAQAQLPQRASQAAVQKLVNADQNPSSREIAPLTSDFNKVLNSAGISVPEFNAVVSDAQTDTQGFGSQLGRCGADSHGCENNRRGRVRDRSDRRSSKKFGRK